MDRQPVKWRPEFRATVGVDDPDASYELIVSQADNGTWDWHGSDFMAWQSHEAHGFGNEPTAEAARVAVEHWWFEGRFVKPSGIDTIF